jgi:Flp pilus assembly protein TadB
MDFGLSKIVIYLVLALVVSGAIGAAYLGWKHNIEQQVVLELNQRQLEQTQKDQQEFIRQQQEISDRQRAIARDMEQRNRSLQTRIDATNRFINSPQAAASDRPASDVLKQTIEQLRTQGNTR